MRYFSFLISVLLGLQSCSEKEVEETSIPIIEPAIHSIIQNFDDPSSGQVLVAAHRAHWNNYPENSLSAIQSAINIGVDIVEIDIRITRDNKLILMHDKTLDRTTTGTGEVKYKFLSQISELKMKDWMGNVHEEQVPTLEEALLLAKDKILVMIDKAEYLIPEVMEVVEKADMVNQVIFLGFDDLSLQQEKFGSRLEDVYYVPALHKSMSNLGTYVEEYQATLSPKAFAFWFDSDDSFVLDYIEDISANSRIWINTTGENQSANYTDKVSLANPDNGWGWVIDRGANIILTDYPSSLLQYLRNQDLHD